MVGSIDLLAAAAQDITVNVPGGDSFWQTAIVAVGAALLGSAVGGYASFRANEALEQRRREARAKIRRKAKVYTPIRSELMRLQEARERGAAFDPRRIIREKPPAYLHPAASLHLWKDLVEDGRSLTAASKTIRDALNKVDELADAFNQQLKRTWEVFGNRGEAVLNSIGQETSLVNWVETDTPAFLRGEFDDLQVTGVGLPGDAEFSSEDQKSFEEAWKGDEEIERATQEMLKIDTALGAALTDAIEKLEAAMLRIAKKYEKESPND